MAEPPLLVEGFGRRYRRRRPWAVRDVTFALSEGSVTALVGPNGAGKTTLIRACLGFERPDQGRVLVTGIDPARDRVAAVNAIGYVSQTTALYQHLTIGDHLDLARIARPRFDREHSLERVRSAGLGADRRVSELSGGERAQVALALALGTRSPLMLLDEPLASLDPLARREFLRTLVDDVRARRTTAILSSHIVTDVEQACDRLIVLAGGRLLLHQAIDAAKRDHRTMRVDGLDGRLPIGTFPALTGEPLALVRDAADGHAATLEEVVLGYLAGARAGGTIPAA